MIWVKEKDRRAKYTETNEQRRSVMTKKTYQMETIACPSCVAKIEGMLKKTTGVDKSEVLFNSARVKVEFDENTITTEDIQNRIEKLGYKVLSVK